MTIPDPWQDRDGEYRLHYERMNPDTVEKTKINGHEITFVVETPYEDCFHPCSVEDVKHLLSLVPKDDLEDLDIVAFRQPTRKQRLLSPVWGRLKYFADIRGIEGSAIILESFDPSLPIKRPRKQSLGDRQELARLREDGHEIEETSRHFIIHPTPDTVRNTVLYRTVPHELGHWVDYMEKVVWTATSLGEDERDSFDLYFARPSDEREAFAHRYATNLINDLQKQEVVPFDAL